MKRLTLIIAYVLLSLAAVVASFSLLAFTSSTAYAHESDGDSRQVNQTQPAKPTGEVRIDNLAGTVRISGWDKNEVRVTGTLGPQVERLEFTSDDSGVEIRVVLPHNENSDDCDECADLDIEVPAGSRMEVSTVSADIQAKDLTGDVRLGTVSGQLTLDSNATRVDVHSVSGDVVVDGSAKGAHLSATSVSGEVRVTGTDGNLHAESVSGDVKVHNNHLATVDMSSTSGNVDYDGPVLKNGDYEFHNVSGDLELNFGSSPNAHFDVSSFSGDIENSFGPKANRVSKYSPGMELHFTNGSGDAQVSARSLSGDVRINE
jgi:DUF4097 and DUF4098 domain-containing protein YvlB